MPLVVNDYGGVYVRTGRKIKNIRKENNKAFNFGPHYKRMRCVTTRFHDKALYFIRSVCESISEGSNFGNTTIKHRERITVCIIIIVICVGCSLIVLMFKADVINVLIIR